MSSGTISSERLTEERSRRNADRDNSVARVTTISSRSPESFDAAIRQGIARAHSTLRNVSGAWIKEQKVELDDGRISCFHVVLEVSFVLDD